MNTYTSNQAHAVAASRRPLGALALSVLAAGAALVAFAAPAPAQDAGSSEAASFNTPYGYAYGGERQTFDPRTRDANGNRLIINGRMVLGENASTLPRSLAGDYTASFGGVFGTPSAIGNQLNVVVDGNWNTVVINNTQTNTGDITADADTALNGELDLDD